MAGIHPVTTIQSIQSLRIQTTRYALCLAWHRRSSSLCSSDHGCVSYFRFGCVCCWQSALRTTIYLKRQHWRQDSIKCAIRRLRQMSSTSCLKVADCPPVRSLIDSPEYIPPASVAKTPSPYPAPLLSSSPARPVSMYKPLEQS